MEFSHIPVLLQETIDSLEIKPDGIYLDATAGGAGHSSEILKRLGPNGHLICLDQDPDAIAIVTKRIGGDPRVTVVQENFSNLTTVVEEKNLPPLSGILADLGVSSHQLDTPERGFSFHHDAPLDMRMSQDGPTAADLVNTLSEQELKTILYTYGEEKFAPRIAKAIVEARGKSPIETTLQLSDIVSNAVPAKARRAKHPARRTFQALRIAVNGEMDALDNALGEMYDALAPGGILSIITFHSLEDRMVKQRFASFCQGCICPPEFPVCVCGRTPAAELPFKFRVASEEELEQNPRSRSARLRSVRKIHARYLDE
ncbi:MAG: 16S rRNA (cytosine(1402)-N(4))-methyltransferase RsmH [Acutalibacteraceae bacterium]|nr:16S rRNA (cytosine(1402)-N(4))-methyltransferase RsmH [Acutalibacteraceae bacterium]